MVSKICKLYEKPCKRRAFLVLCACEVEEQIVLVNNSLRDSEFYPFTLTFFIDYLLMSNDLGETPNFNGNVLNKYVNLKREVEAKKDSVFANKQLEKNLTFEDETFTVVVPTTIAELVKEGEEQHNCVGDYGYDKKVLEGKCNIVFIRKKISPNKSYITCEINPNGHIIQYYLAHNYSVYDDNPAYDFKLKYMEYLQTIFC